MRSSYVDALVIALGVLGIVMGWPWLITFVVGYVGGKLTAHMPWPLGLILTVGIVALFSLVVTV